MRIKKKSLFWLAFVSLLTMGIPAYAATSYTTADVAQHNTAGNCWVTVGIGVYDLTAIMAWHPNVITCGANMTALYLGKHTTLSNINPYYIGDLFAVVPPAPVVNVTNTTNTTTPANTTIPTNTTGNTSVNTGNSTNPTNTSVPVANSTNTSLGQYAPSMVLTHNSSNDCWVSVFGKIYDVTPVMATYGYFYTCGVDNTASWQASIFGNDTSIMDPFYVGTVAAAIPPTGTNTTTNTTNTTTPVNNTTTTNTTNTNTTIPANNSTNTTNANTTNPSPGSGNSTNSNGNQTRHPRDDDAEDDDGTDNGNDGLHEQTREDREDARDQIKRSEEAAKQARENAREKEKQAREQAREQAKTAAEQARAQAKAMAEQAREERKSADKAAKQSRHEREEDDD